MNDIEKKASLMLDGIIDAIKQDLPLEADAQDEDYAENNHEDPLEDIIRRIHELDEQDQKRLIAYLNEEKN